MRNSRSYKLIHEQALTSGLTLKNIVKVRARPTDWQILNSPVVLPFSIHSAIYNGIKGHYKIKALLNYVKLQAKDKIIVLFCEGAHLNTLSLKYSNLETAFAACRNDANDLFERFKKDLIGLKVTFWEDIILKHKYYHQFKLDIISLLVTDTHFQNLVDIDASKTYSKKLSIEYPDKDLFVEKNRLDIIEMMLGCKIMSEEGCRTWLYPGSMLDSMKYLHHINYYNLFFVSADIRVNEITI